MIRQLMVMLLMASVWTTGCRNSSMPAKSFAKLEASVTSKQGTVAGRQETVDKLYGRAFTLLRAKKYAKSLEVFDRILASNPRDADALFERASVLALLNRKPAAIDSLRQAIDAGFIEFGWLTLDRGIRELSGEKAFAALMQEFDVVLEETRSPSLENIRRILAEPRFHRFLPRLLPRYHSTELTGDTLRLLDSQDLRLQRGAVVSLLHQNADKTSTRARVAMLFASPEAEIREAVAEYFLWHGTMADREILAKAAAQEFDPFTRSAEWAALELIASRARWMSSLKEEGHLPNETSSQEALGQLWYHPTPEVLRQIIEVYRLGWSFEPKLVYDGMNFDARALAEQHNRFNLAIAIFRFRQNPPSGKEIRSKDLPVATSFMAPVRDYFNPWRQSYGVRTGSSGPFKNSVHCGDDVALNADDGTVVSIADGVVRLISHVYSWGVIIIVEHRLPKKEGYCCSLYAHLAPSISVARGQLVKKGQRIAAVGRSYTWENGGYQAHLHFGIHRGSYLQSRFAKDVDLFGFDASTSGQDFATVSRRVPGSLTAKPDALWITGYIDLKRWAAGRHGWVNPQQFIGKRVESSNARR